MISIFSLRVKALEVNLDCFDYTRKIFEEQTMPAPFSDKKRSLNNGVNLTTGLLRAPSRVLISAGFTTLYFPGYFSTIRAFLY